MWEDPIVAEVHRIREQIAEKYNYDVKAYFADLRRRQAASGDKVVHPKKQAESSAKTPPNSAPSDSAPAA
jgi:hypothetical protein